MIEEELSTASIKGQVVAVKIFRGPSDVRDFSFPRQIDSDALNFRCIRHL